MEFPANETFGMSMVKLMDYDYRAKVGLIIRDFSFIMDIAKSLCMLSEHSADVGAQ